LTGVVDTPFQKWYGVFKRGIPPQGGVPSCIFCEPLTLIVSLRLKGGWALSSGAAGPRGRGQEDAKLTEAEVWTCTGPSCKGWMRRDLSFEEQPVCPLCGSEMKLSVRKVPKLIDLK